MIKKMAVLFSLLVIISANIAFSQVESATSDKTDKELESECYALVKEKLNFLEQPRFQGTTKSSYREGHTLISLSFVSRSDTGQNTFWSGLCEIENKIITSVEIIDMN
ncbi:hypothetical protein MMG00_09225 [Ignatzschineria rhizosphaerae]|uniref:Uncharacterized protein n=1 Tax=Ignatzschineria rhizosphaerae TaxID=2923279 RepID=A0ABY3X311_9GAMM|nr:hypothetical protein [Ignatzschineria rhizosphaerae]UNM95407.1 hypothetical protein MMG00_09225 [Ignatzschineria rhizosphaerae]